MKNTKRPNQCSKKIKNSICLRYQDIALASSSRCKWLSEMIGRLAPGHWEPAATQGPTYVQLHVKIADRKDMVTLSRDLEIDISGEWQVQGL